MFDRIINSEISNDEEVVESSIRPQHFDEYVGQSAIVSQMEIFIEAARTRGEALDHTLLFGPPGLCC